MELNYKIGLILNYSSAILLVLAIILGVLKMRSLNFRERIFYSFIAFDFISVGIAEFTRSSNNLYIFHIFAIVNLILLTFAFFPVQSSSRLKVILGFAVILIFSLAFYEAFIDEKSVAYFNSLTNTVSGVFILTLTIRQLLRIRHDELILDLSKEPSFWFAFSITLLYSAVIMTLAFQKSIQDISMNTLINLTIIQQAFHVIAIIGYVKGLSLVKTKEMKS